MTPSLTIICRPNFDTVSIRCAHGQAMAAGPSRTAGEMNELIEQAMARRSCKCPVAALTFMWPSMAEALATYKEDLAKDGDKGTDMENAMLRETIEAIERHACPTCDPAYIQIIKAGTVKREFIHEHDTCTIRPKTTRVLQPIQQGTIH